MTRFHTQQFCDAFARFPSQCKGHFTQNGRLLLGSASVGWCTGGKPFSENYALTCCILTPEAPNLHPPAHLLPRTRQVCQRAQVVRMHAIGNLPAYRASGRASSRFRGSCNHLSFFIDINTDQGETRLVGEQQNICHPCGPPSIQTTIISKSVYRSLWHMAIKSA